MCTSVNTNKLNQSETPVEYAFNKKQKAKDFLELFQAILK